MSITLIAVGKMKEKPYRQMANEYLKRLSRYGKVEEIELPDLPEPQNSSPAIEAEGRRYHSFPHQAQRLRHRHDHPRQAVGFPRPQPARG